MKKPRKFIIYSYCIILNPVYYSSLVVSIKKAHCRFNDALIQILKQ